MNFRRSISILILLAFLPCGLGCSTSRTLLVAEDDPAGSETGTSFKAGEPIEITGYTRPDDGFRAWRGYVQAAPPDSLLFTQPVESRRRGTATSFRLAMADVVSIDSSEFSPGKTAVLTIGVVAAIAIAVTAIVAHQVSTGVSGLGNW